MVRRCVFSVLLAAMLSSAVFAQTLARPGWQGSGLTVESWWQSSIFYQIDLSSFQNTKGNFREVLERLDYLQSLGVDALVLSPLPLEAASGSHRSETSATSPFDPAYGTEEDLSVLVQEASRRRMRVLVDLPFDSTLSEDETANAARFWLSRGIAGLILTKADPQGVPLTAAQTSSRLVALDHLLKQYPGQRILFWDLPEPQVANVATVRVSHKRRRAAPKQTAEAVGDSLAKAPQLRFDDRLLQLNHWQAEELRGLLKGRPHTYFPLAASVLASDAGNHPRSFDRFSNGAHPAEIARQTAALLLLGQAVPQLYAGQEIGMQTASATAVSKSAEDDQDSLLNWYRRLSSLRHANLALRGGSLDVLALANPDLVAWVRRPPSAAAGASPVVVICNVSPHAAKVTLSAELHARGIPVGTGMLRTLASSAASANLNRPVPLDAISLPAYGVYVGELQLQPGLESAPAPTRRRPGRRSQSRSTSEE